MTRCAALNESPYGMRPAFASGDNWVQTMDIADRIAAEASHAPCDRACLDDYVDRFLKALVAHDARLLPVAQTVKYTENGQRLPLNDGLWGTATKIGDFGIRLADPSSGIPPRLRIQEVWGRPSTSGEETKSGA